MVFDYIITTSEGRQLRVGQVHVDISPLEQQKGMSEALKKLGKWLDDNELSKIPATILIARV